MPWSSKSHLSAFLSECQYINKKLVINILTSPPAPLLQGEGSKIFSLPQRSYPPPIPALDPHPALDSPPSLAGKGAGGLGQSNVT